jgi:hypothetical protein
MKHFPKRVQYHQAKYGDFKRKGMRFQGRPYIWNFTQIAEGLTETE